MKITFLALVILALSTKPLLGTTFAAPEQVVDISGKIVRAGVKYNIIPADSSNFFFSMMSIGEQTCPQDVVLAEGIPTYGIPVVFTPFNTKKGVVRVHTDLNINYSINYSTGCSNSNVWKLKDYDYPTGQWFVTTGGVVGTLEREIFVSWFKIEKYEDAYKLSYCPSNVCKDCGYECMAVGIYEDENYGKRLALSYVPYKIQFKVDTPEE